MADSWRYVVGGYLTTPGQKPEEAWRMVEDMGFEVEAVKPVVGR